MIKPQTHTVELWELWELLAKCSSVNSINVNVDFNLNVVFMFGPQQHSQQHSVFIYKR